MSNDAAAAAFYNASLAQRRGCAPLTTMTNRYYGPSGQRPSLTPSTATSMFSQDSSYNSPMTAYSEATSDATSYAPSSYLAPRKTGGSLPNSRRGSAKDGGWTLDDDQRLRAAVANVTYERSHQQQQGSSSMSDAASSTSGKSWARIALIAFPDGRHSKDDCAVRYKLITKPSVVKGAWSKAEDDRLLRLVEEHGAERWVIIAQHMGSRSGKQCRERWHNHVDPCILRKPFTPEEDAIIIALYNQIGSKWAEMSKRLKGRPDNSIKNHFNTTLSRRRMLAAAVSKIASVEQPAAQQQASGIADQRAHSMIGGYTEAPLSAHSMDTGDAFADDAAMYHAKSLQEQFNPYAQQGAAYDHRRASAPFPIRHQPQYMHLNFNDAVQQASPFMSNDAAFAGFDDRDGQGPRFTSALAYGQQMQAPQPQQHFGDFAYSVEQQPQPPAPAPEPFSYLAQDTRSSAAQWLAGQQDFERSQAQYNHHGAVERGSAYSAVQYTSAATPRRTPSNDLAIEEQRGEGGNLRQQAESLSSWQSVNGQRALPPLSLVAGSDAMRSSPQTPNRPRAQSVITRLTSSACGANTRDASEAGGANSALAMADVDEGQKAALLRPQVNSMASSSMQRVVMSGGRTASGTKRSSSDMEDASPSSEERPRQRANISPSSPTQMLAATQQQAQQQQQQHLTAASESSRYSSATPNFAAEQDAASFLSHRDSLSVPGSAMTAASSLLPSPMDAMHEQNADYFGVKQQANALMLQPQQPQAYGYQFTDMYATEQAKNAMGLYMTEEHAQ